MGLSLGLGVVSRFLIRLRRTNKNATLLHVSFKEGFCAHFLPSITYPVLQPSVRLGDQVNSHRSCVVAQRYIMSNLGFAPYHRMQSDGQPAKFTNYREDKYAIQYTLTNLYIRRACIYQSLHIYPHFGA